MTSRIWPITGKSYTPYINGKFTNPIQQNLRKLINPTDKSVITTIHESSLYHVEKALISAKATTENSEWQTNPKFRRDCLLKFSDQLEKNVNDLANIESLQTGKPPSDALYEMNDVIDCLRYFAGYCDKIYGQSQGIQSFHGYTVREPLGTVSLITSFNYPLLLTSWKLGPALAAGNCAIIKPAPQTPLSSLALAELSADILPPGVISVLPGGVQVSQALIDQTDKTSFTGSTLVGQDIMRRGANRLLPLTLECGGKNTAIVFDDASLDKTVENVAMGAFSNAGQNCCAISKVLVQKSIYNTFLERLSETVTNSWQATLDEDGTGRNLYGPLIDENQYTRVLKYIQQTEQTPFLVGDISAKTKETGYFIPPTIYTNVPDDSMLAKEEIFGPVLSILKPFEEMDDAIERANASEYGLAAGVFSNDLKKAHQTANRLKTGYVWVNTYNIMTPSLPFGGTKLSGIGKDLGVAALNQFSFEKSIMMDLS